MKKPRALAEVCIYQPGYSLAEYLYFFCGITKYFWLSITQRPGMHKSKFGPLSTDFSILEPKRYLEFSFEKSWWSPPCPNGFNEIQYASLTFDDW